MSKDEKEFVPANPISTYKHSSHPEKLVVEALEHLHDRIAALEVKGKKAPETKKTGE